MKEHSGNKILPWINLSDDLLEDPVFECPDCHGFLTLPPFSTPEENKFRYCPFCGAERISK